MLITNSQPSNTNLGSPRTKEAGFEYSKPVNQKGTSANRSRWHELTGAETALPTSSDKPGEIWGIRNQAGNETADKELGGRLFSVLRGAPAESRHKSSSPRPAPPPLPRLRTVPRRGPPSSGHRRGPETIGHLSKEVSGRAEGSSRGPGVGRQPSRRRSGQQAG